MQPAAEFPGIRGIFGPDCKNAAIIQRGQAWRAVLKKIGGDIANQALT